VSYIYGRVAGRDPKRPMIEDDGSGSKLVESLAGLLPADLLAAHGMIVAATTKTIPATGGGEATVEVIAATALKWGAVGLIAASFVLFAFGLKKAPTEWSKHEWLQSLIPPISFITWMMLTGTSALTPWLPKLSTPGRTVIGVVLGLIMVGAATAVAGEQAPVAGRARTEQSTG
jgi:hypothetical protein